MPDISGSYTTNETSDYTEYIVDSNSQIDINLYDGETWENNLIDLTASGAEFDIDARQNSWTIRNLGIKGQMSSSPGTQNFTVSVDSSSGEGIIENVYYPGTSYSRSTSAYPSGIYVMNYHTGHLSVKNYYVEDLPSHAIYASTFQDGSNDPGYGTISIENSYTDNNENSGWRIAGDGSWIDSSNSYRTVRGIWVRQGTNPSASNSHHLNNTTDIIVDDNCALDVDNVYYESSSGTINGSSAGTPQKFVPDGCPTSAEEAASGGGGSGGGGGGSEPTPDYESLELNQVSGDGNYDWVSDPAGGDNQVLHVWYPQGEHRGLNARDYFTDMVGHEPDVAHVRYQLYIPTSFTLQDSGVNGGTKIPGMADHRNGGAAGGNHNQGAAWSARMFYPRRNEKYDQTDGDEVPCAMTVYDGSLDPNEHEYGWHEAWSQGGPLKGEWFTIDYRLTMNTPGQTDGTIEGWVNGEPAYDETDRQFLFIDEDHSDQGIRSWRWHFYFGGSWTSPEYNELYAKDMKVWVGDNATQIDPTQEDSIQDLFDNDDFSHNDLSSHYYGDLSAFGTSYGNEYYAHNAGDDQSDSVIYHNGSRVEEGNTYTWEFEITGDNPHPDLGLVVCGSGHPFADNFDGYFVFLGPNETRLDRWDGGSVASSQTGSAVPLNDRLTAEVDFRETDSDIHLTITDSSGSTVESLTMSDKAYSTGDIGLYQWRDGDFRIYSMYDTDTPPGSGDTTGSNFDVSILGTNSPVTPGETMQVDYEVINTGDTSDTQDITLTLGDEATNEVVTIDDFSSGINSSWTNNSSYSTTEDGDATGGYAAYRTEASTPLTAGPSTYAHNFSTGDYFVVFTLKTLTGSGGYFLFDGDQHFYGQNSGYALRFETTNGNIEINETVNGSWSGIADGQATLSDGEYYTVVGQRTSDNNVLFQFYDSSEQHMGQVGASLPSTHNNYWGITSFLENTNTRFGKVEFHENHPFTGRHYTENPPDGFE